VSARRPQWEPHTVMDRATSSSAAHARFAAKLSEVEEDLAKLRGAREEMLSVKTKAAAPPRTVDDDEVTSRSSDDGLAEVHIDAQGDVVKVDLDSAGYHGSDERDLCAAVLHARKRARSHVMRRGFRATP